MKARLFIFLVLATLILSACGSGIEKYEIRGQSIQGFVSVTSKTVEFEGRVTGEPGRQFWLYSQEEGVGEGTSNYSLLSCTVDTFDSAGNAYIKCQTSVDKKHRQNALVLASLDDPQAGRVERIEYRPNIVRGIDEQYQLMDYNYSLLKTVPSSVENPMYIYRSLGLKMKINSDFNRYPPSYSDPIDVTFAPSRGFYLTFVSKHSCGGVYLENHVNLYRWDGDSYEFAESVRLEDVDFEGSGSHDFNVKGYTVRLTFSDHYKCRREYEYIDIP